MRAVCDIDVRSGADRSDNVLEREQLREDYLADQVKHPELLYHRTLWRVQSTEERAASVRALAKDACLGRCAYADALEAGR
jgi:hypothetical protein